MITFEILDHKSINDAAKKAAKKLREKNKSIRSNNVYYIFAHVGEREVVIIRTHINKGRGTHSFIRDRSADILEVLDALGISYYKDNDAAKGGKNGNYVALNKSDLLNAINKL